MVALTVLFSWSRSRGASKGVGVPGSPDKKSSGFRPSLAAIASSRWVSVETVGSRVDDLGRGSVAHDLATQLRLRYAFNGLHRSHRVYRSHARIIEFGNNLGKI